MIDAGMSVARLNFSHGHPDEHRVRASRLRSAAAAAGATVALIQDLQGPKIRTVAVPATTLSGGETVVLGAPGGAGTIPISEPAVLDGAEPGHRVYIDDGAIELEVLGRVAQGVRCQVLVGGRIEGNEGVVFPSARLELPALTQRDLADLAVGREIGTEWVALSFVQRADDIHGLRRELGGQARIIAKIETPAALEDLEAIVVAADAVMVARGDLGVAIRRARVPLVQKEILQLCRRHAVSGIVATEMLLSMVENPHPTRAEVADVATAVLDGCDAVMLSEETAVGAHPVEAIAEMREIVETIEASSYYQWTTSAGSL
jgi:pyruvate kinase